MNTDCLFNIAQFAGPNHAVRITRELAVNFLPSSIAIEGHKQLEEFYSWCRLFDTSKLTEVQITIEDAKILESIRTNYPNAARADGLVVSSPIGLVPPSVKKLSLCVFTGEPILIPDTVEELVIEQTGGIRGLAIPDSVRSLHLMGGFDNFITRWPANLETLTICGWCYGNGRWPVPIEDIPDTVTHLTIGAHLDIEITRWPASLKHLRIDGEPELFGWSETDLDLPPGVRVLIWVPADQGRQMEDREFHDVSDLYEDPSVEMWHL
jgi:hypothetical protein